MTKRPSPDTVIDLTLAGDEDQEFRLGEVRKVLNPGKKVTTELNQEGSIDLTLIDDDDDQELSINYARETNSSKKVKTELNWDESWQGRKPAAKKAQPRPIEKEGKKATQGAVDIDEEIQILEDDEETSFPLVAVTKTNSKDDDLEIVGIRNEVILPHNRCDCPKNEFSMSSCGTHQNKKHCDKCYCYVCDCLASECKSWISKCNAHCNATDKVNCWVQKRQEKKENKELRQNPHEAVMDTYNPKKCRKCGFEAPFHSFHSGRDKCQNCGRVISEIFLDKERSLKYKRIAKDVYIGERVVDFRISAPDLRCMDEYKDSWQEADKDSPAWKYDESDMEEDIFRHRLGKRPDLQTVLSLVSRKGKGRVKKDHEEAIILENENDLFLLQFLSVATDIGKGNSKDHRTGRISADNRIRGNIEATWRKTDRRGTFKVQLFLPNTTFSTGVSFYLEEGFSLLLGLWFNIFPLVLAEVCGSLKARNGTEYTYSDSEKERKAIKESVDNHNKNVQAFRNQISLTSSTGYSGVGGKCNNDQSLKGVLKSFFQDTYKGCKVSHNWSVQDFEWETVLKGDIMRHSPESSIEYLLNHRDCTMIHHHIRESKVSLDISKVNSVMDHIENLGHEGLPYVEGLNIELLDFQKQSLQWCLEREKVKGGIQTFFWPKLPQGEGFTNLYYNPILQRLSEVQPQLVRGGFIADEMGLGKTVISLALILENCAPPSPVSGSQISSLPQTPSSEDGIVTWDKDLYARTAADDPKRGSIISRATLVICPVSLVGQWIEEAKSKLKNPGLIYPYHGQNRIRDPDMLAKNAIVVTTYQVLASDDTHHRGKSGDGYCPPCETIRWWRIICDEGHHLRESNTKRNRAITNLVADHKWLVSGTPLNTSLKDLKNQLKFIGIQHVDSYFSKFFPKMKDNKAATANPCCLIFMLRNIMMRHAQKQMYRNSKTTLMSLPSKTERVIEISFSSKTEKEHYDNLDKNAKDFYIKFKKENESDISKHYLKLSQKLTPLRVACAGGPYPLIDNKSDDGMEEEVEENGKKKKKSDVVYSTVAFKSKFKALISELERCRDEDASSKSLVFSQYASTLNWLKNELPNHGFQFRTLSGDMSMKDRAKALSDFQKDPPTTIFLLSMRAGNCGINLTQANRVFLMEPNFNPALEKQAIGRVHRLGQKREVEVIRLLVKDTVETRISNFLRVKYGVKPVPKAKGEAEPGEKSEMTTPIGNIATERPKNKILTKEFDILFGVEIEETDDKVTCMPDNAPSSGSI